MTPRKPLLRAAIGLMALSTGCVMIDSPTVVGRRRVPGPARPNCPPVAACPRPAYVVNRPTEEPIIEPNPEPIRPTPGMAPPFAPPAEMPPAEPANMPLKPTALDLSPPLS